MALRPAALALSATSPLLRRAVMQPAVMQSVFRLATASASSARPVVPFTRTPGLGLALQQHQQRLFGTNQPISRNLLASREAAANRNPGSATAQNAFYQLLLKANMPAIVIERYNSGRFARNEAVDQAYAQAVGMQSTAAVGGLGGHDHLPSAFGNVGAVGGQELNQQSPGNLSQAQLQAVGQALAARSRDSNMATAKVQGNGQTGPLHVVVDESFGGIVFRWVKFVLWFCLFTYLSLVVVTMLVEGLNLFKRPGGKVDSEAKAENQTTRFADVHGADEAKDELQELVDFLRNPDKFSTLGGKLPKGILMVGPPGTGKTLLARAVAGEAGVPFFYMSGSEFDEVYVGVGAKRVRDLFASAKSKSPAIIFIDELDAIGGRRNTRDAAYHKQTLNQLLTELDGFEQNSGVVIIAATNFPELLDKALTRPGRFDRHVTVPLPDVRGRIEILKYHAKKIKAAPEINFEAIASSTGGLSGAELENIVNQAAVRASRLKAAAVSMTDFEWAKDKVIMGAERKSMVIGEKEKEMTAYHEAGHALVSFYHESGPNKLYKVTILPRGQSLGHTAHLPEMDKYSYTTRDLKSLIETSLGGKLAEELVYGTDKVTTGVSSDLKNATNLAYQMVALYGMSAKLGPVEYGERYNQLSGETKALIESEVQRTLTESYEKVRELLTKKRKELDLLAKALVEYETLDKNEVEKVIRGEKLPGRTPMPKGPMKVPAGAAANIGQTMPPPFPPPPGAGEGTAAPPPSPPPPASTEGIAPGSNQKS
ncbi:mitochondrial inner membrane i-AAA protease supercomplex subunit YME1 [Colletotrichum spaethianum]|uniref:Mitochondrial inner membrane i-AAA protease supercomplex subunit YME1 n=1 Tax=Colletotrichum spaethianum TaxID=700344 RepID=A0AA37P1R0_9PEZI|nr:mitochondrial inner membrane i-AAA protease supercomplex subunit YME1 [Colletotrichum spaethianum]GKT47090.1 mitochondrial inner membrane i-AAA protease supercomplex subunit YME1 [Colletotrichum spaethianum]